MKFVERATVRGSIRILQRSRQLHTQGLIPEILCPFLVEEAVGVLNPDNVVGVWRVETNISHNGYNHVFFHVEWAAEVGL